MAVYIVLAKNYANGIYFKPICLAVHEREIFVFVFRVFFIEHRLLSIRSKCYLIFPWALKTHIRCGKKTKKNRFVFVDMNKWNLKGFISVQ